MVRWSSRSFCEGRRVDPDEALRRYSLDLGSYPAQRRMIMPRHIFLSYVRENADLVSRLASDLKDRGFKVWLDRDEIDPGQRWQDAVRDAIRSGDMFVACFSHEYALRETTYMNEELTLAIDELRQRSTETSWFIPVSIDGADIPRRRISSNETLLDIQWVDLSKDWKAGIDRIARVAYKLSLALEERSRSLQEVLRSCWGVTPADDLSDPHIIRNLGAKFVIEDVLLDCAFGGYTGVDEAMLSVLPSPSSAPQLPAYVYDARSSIPQPEGNRTKTYLARWTPPIIDQGNYARLYTGYLDPNATTGRYDYWTTKAVIKSVARIQQDLLAGRIDLESLARRLDLVVVVVTSDRKLVLARRGEAVDNLGGFWMASIGESVDGDVDRNDAGVPDPTRTVYRCMTEADELNLTIADLDQASVTYLGLATEWAYMYVNLLVLVELRVGFERVIDRASQGEHSRFEVVDFTPDACLPFLRSGAFAPRYSLPPSPLVPASRMALLLSLFSKFGYDEVIGRIVAMR
jgi:TIR domain